MTSKKPHLFFLSISFWHKFDMSDNNERWDWFLFIIYYYSSIINVWPLSQFDQWADGTYFIFYMVCLYLISFAKNSILYITISLLQPKLVVYLERIAMYVKITNLYCGLLFMWVVAHDVLDWRVYVVRKVFPSSRKEYSTSCYRYTRHVDTIYWKD